MSFSTRCVFLLLRIVFRKPIYHQDNPIYVFKSERIDLTLQLTDDYAARNQMLSQLLKDSANWFELALGRAPVELHATLQVNCVV